MELVKKKINERGFYLEKILVLVDKIFEGKNSNLLREANLSSSYIDSMKRRLENGKNPVPTVEAVNNMINAATKRDPNFNPLWLIRENESMFDPRRNREVPIAAEPVVNYLSSAVQELEQGGGLGSEELPKDFPLKVARLLVKLLELEHAG